MQTPNSNYLIRIKQITKTESHAKDPHGFTLLHHAQRGGENAEVIVDYLISLGAKETKIA